MVIFVRPVSPDYNLLVCYPEVAAEWDYDKNHGLMPDSFSPHSGKKVWWKCSKCGYQWESTINTRTNRGHGCPVCSHQMVVPGRNDLLTLFPEIAKYWDYEKNTKAPDQVFPGTATKYWWTCEQGHSYLESPNIKTNMQTGCPICSGHRLLKGVNDLKTQFPSIAAEWDYDKNSKKPEDYSAHNGAYAWWLCPQGHSYKTRIYNRTANDSTGCPYCSGHKVLPGFNDLVSQYPDLASQWHPEKNKPLTPEQVSAGSNRKAWWLCPICGNEWRAAIYSRTGDSKTSCPKCNQWYHTSKTEQILYYYIYSVFPDAINGYKLMGKSEIDVYIPSKNIGVEYDGERWHGEEKKSVDEEKGLFIKENGIKLYRLREPKCAKISDGSVIVVTPVPQSNFSHLTAALRTLLGMWVEDGLCESIPDIDIERDTTRIMASFARNTRIKSLAESFPSLSKEWDYKKNNGLSPENISAHSSIKVWWICNTCGHSWQAVVASRVQGNGCPACREKNRGSFVRKGHFHPGVNDLVSVAPDIAKEWDYSKNDEIPENVVKGSHKKYWWICPKGHSYEASVKNRVNGRGCPFCAGKRKVET